MDLNLNFGEPVVATSVFVDGWQLEGGTGYRDVGLLPGNRLVIRWLGPTQSPVGHGGILPDWVRFD